MFGPHYYPHHPSYIPYGTPMIPYYHRIINQSPQVQHYSQRPYQPIDAKPFHDSAIAFQSLMDQANIIVRKLVHSKEFARKLMEAAQQSDQELVDSLVQTTGVTADVTTVYNPDEIKFELRSQVEGTDCCLLTMALRWS